jgi:hypothetical protein
MRIVPKIAAKLVERRSEAKRAPVADTLSSELELLVARFDGSTRRELRRLIRSSERLADLAHVFPGALYAIAVRRGTPASRLQALSLIEQGAPLKTVARTLDLPLWLRKLPPEAFVDPLGTLPGSEAFSRRISTRLPHDPEESPRWLAAVAFAAEAASEEFAVWIAEQPLYGEPLAVEKLFTVLAAYAWFSCRPEASAHSLIVVPWRPEIAFDTAVCAAKSWLNRLRLVMQLKPGVIAEPWLTAGEAMGYSFVPLVEQDEILAEAHAMQNCADQYADRLSRDKCRLFSIRHHGTRVATLEIGPHTRESGVLAITQLKARHNMPASIEVWRAAHAWLSMQPGLKRLPPMLVPERPLDAGIWHDLMQPYRDAKGGAPWLTDAATHGAFAMLDADMAELARRGGVTSWLFT